MFDDLKKFIFNIFNIFASNIFLLAVITVLISINAGGNYFYKVLPICIAVLIYFIPKKKIMNFLSVLSFALLFSVFRFLLPLVFNLLSSLFILNKLICFMIFDFLLAFFGFYILNIILFIVYELLTKGRVEFKKVVVNKKKVIISLVVIVLVTGFCLIKELPKYRFGYFVEGPEMKYEHGSDAVFKLKDGNILFLGNLGSFNVHNRDYTQTEIYDYKNNKFIIINMPKDFLYLADGLLLKNNKLLLTCVSDLKNPAVIPDNFGNKDNDVFAYNKMTIINLDTMKVEKILTKHLPLNECGAYARFTLLGDNKIFIIYKNLQNEIYVEIYDLKNNTSKILNKKYSYKKSYYDSQELAVDNNKVLIFNTNGTVEKYDDVKNEISVVGNIIPRKNFVLQKLNNKEVAILGGNNCIYRSNANPKYSCQDIQDVEIYNLDTNKVRRVGNLMVERSGSASSSNKYYFGTSLFKNNLIFIAGGSLPYYNNFGSNALKSAEIFNYQTGKSYRLPDMPYRLQNSKIFTLDNGDILITDFHKKTVLFKTWKRGD